MEQTCYWCIYRIFQIIEPDEVYICDNADSERFDKIVQEGDTCERWEG